MLKRFGNGRGYFSFPEEGFTLALDFKASSANKKAVQSMIEIVKKYNGKIYLAKDSLMNADDKKLISQQTKIDEFNNFRNFKFESELTRGVGL